MRGRIIPQGNFQLQNTRGHEFQNDQAHDLPLSALTKTPRNVYAKAERVYKPDPVSAAQQSLLTGEQNPFAELYALQRKAVFSQISYTYTTVPVLILPAASRTYLLIQNLDAALNMFLGFGFIPDGVNGIGIRVAAGLAYEPAVIPQNDIFIVGSGSGLTAILYAIG